MPTVADHLGANVSGSRVRTVLLAAAVGFGAFGQSSAPDLRDFAGLAGHWTGTSGDSTIEEFWTAPAGTSLLAVTRTVEGERTTMFEFLRIEKRADGIFFVAQPKGKPPTDFKLTRSGPGLAVFENLSHDFPQMISYRRAGDQLVGKVEGREGGKHVEFEFRYRLASSR